MKLLSVPNIPNYQVDVENGVVYKLKYGRLKEVSMRTKYKSFTIQVNGKTIGTTLYRMMYGATNQIDITKIPTELCISMENGKLVVLDRSMVVRKSIQAKNKSAERLQQIQKNIKMIEDFYAGNTSPMLSYLQYLEKSLVSYFVWIRGFSQERSEIIVCNAINKYLDKLEDGVQSFAIRASVMRYAHGENNKLIKQCDLQENINHKNYEV